MNPYEEMFVITKNEKQLVLFTYADKPYLYNFKDGLKISEMKKFKTKKEAEDYWTLANKNNNLKEVEIIQIKDI
jgi:hypothetical protein